MKNNKIRPALLEEELKLDKETLEAIMFLDDDVPFDHDSKKEEITYTEIDGILYPNLIMVESEENEEMEQEEYLNKYGRMREKFLKEERKMDYLKMTEEDTLMKHLMQIQKEALEMEDYLTPLLKKKYNITEELKMENQLKWVQEMNSIMLQIDEIIKNEIIYV